MKINKQLSVKANLCKTPGKPGSFFLILLLMFFFILPQSVLGTARHDRNKNTIKYQGASAAKKNKQDKMLKMITMLDQLDKMDFQDAIIEAEQCIRAGDFTGAEKAIAKAATFAHDSDDYTNLDRNRKNLAAKIQFEDTINDARINILSRNFSEAKRLLAKAPDSARSTEDRRLIDRVQDELDSERRQQKREEEERREYEKEQRRLARAKREAARNPVFIDDSNKWVGTAMTMIGQARDEVLQDMQQNHDREMQRIAAENSRKKKAKIEREKQKLAYENNLRQKKLRQQRQERERARLLAIEKRKKARAARERAAEKKEKARAARTQAPNVTKTIYSAWANPNTTRSQNNTSTLPSGPKGLAIIWQKKNGKWYGDGPIGETSSEWKDNQAALDIVSNASTTFLTTMNITIGSNSWQCEVYRVNREVDTSWRPSGARRNIRFKYPELERLKSMGLD